MGIVVIGAIFVDIKGYPFDTYIPNGRNSGRIQYIHGGVSRNVAEDIANIDLHPTLISIVDDSALGKDVLQKLIDHEVNTNYILTKTNGMGTWLAVFDSSGDVAGSISQRPDLMPLYELLCNNGDDIISQCESIILEADINKEIIDKVFDLAKKYNKKVYSIVSNISIALERKELLKKFDCFICNEQEAGILFNDNYRTTSPEDLVQIIQKNIKAENIPACVVTMGSKGSVFASQNGEYGICPAKKVQVIDTTGAGDAFCSGVTIGLTYGKTLAEAVKIGTTLAASVITSRENVCPKFTHDELGINLNKIHN